MQGLTHYPATNNKRNSDPFASLARDFFGFEPANGYRKLVTQQQSPRFDFVESPKSYTLHGDLPGVADEDLEVTVHEGVLTISGKRSEQSLTEDDKFLVRERRYGEFTRRLTLPKDADVQLVEAKLNNGVLVISIPKREELQARKIEIK